MRPSIFILGFSIFSMFFGSGNLVFPIQIGMTSVNHWSLGLLGLLISGVIIPFAGVFAIKRYHGSYDRFFKELGLGAHILIPLILLSLLGAFGVVPRCITVAFGGFHLLQPALPLWIFSGAFIVICFFSGLKNTQMLTIIGKFMTPVKLLTLALIIVVGIVYAASALPSQTTPQAFQFGLVEGYQTMDLIAGFFFSSLIFKYIQQRCTAKTDPKIIFWISAKASLIGALMIALAYAGLVYMGAAYAPLLKTVPPTEMLPLLTQHLLGPYSTWVIALTMGFACLATATALNNLYAEFLHKLFKFKEKYFGYTLALTSLVSFAISLLNFKGIAAILTPVLIVIYPGLIVFTLASLIYPHPHILKRVAFYGVTLGMIIWKFI